MLVARRPGIVQGEVDHCPQRHRCGQRIPVRQGLRGRDEVFVAVAIEFGRPPDDVLAGPVEVGPGYQEGQPCKRACMVLRMIERLFFGADRIEIGQSLQIGFQVFGRQEAFETRPTMLLGVAAAPERFEGVDPGVVPLEIHPDRGDGACSRPRRGCPAPQPPDSYSEACGQYLPRYEAPCVAFRRIARHMRRHPPGRLQYPSTPPGLCASGRFRPDRPRIAGRPSYSRQSSVRRLPAWAPVPSTGLVTPSRKCSRPVWPSIGARTRTRESYWP